MITPVPSATGAHTRVTLKRTDFALEIHGTLAGFNRSTGAFAAFLDIDPEGAVAETFDPKDHETATYVDSQGLTWTLVR